MSEDRSIDVLIVIGVLAVAVEYESGHCSSHTTLISPSQARYIRREKREPEGFQQVVDGMNPEYCSEWPKTTMTIIHFHSTADTSKLSANQNTVLGHMSLNRSMR